MNKSKFSKFAACAGISLALAMSAFAQQASSSPESASAPGNKKPSSEMCQRMKAAHKTAMEDPALKKLHDEYFSALKAGMIKADPGLKDALENFGKKGGKCGTDMKNKGQNDPNGKKHGGKLSDTDKKKLKAAREAAQNDVAVIAAQTKKNVATTPEAKQAARREYHKALYDAMIKSDPSLKPILDKMHAQKDASGSQ